MEFPKYGFFKVKVLYFHRESVGVGWSKHFLEILKKIDCDDSSFCLQYTHVGVGKWKNTLFFVLNGRALIY